MANLRYFADLPGGDVAEFKRVDNRNQSARHDDCWGWNGAEWVKITRVVNFKSNASRHECDARCMHATGRTMQCECACGGKNHGRGHFVAEQV